MKLYRQRLIPNEIRELKDDVIEYSDEEIIVTSWKVLNPRTDFNHGMSCYYLKEGFKVSKFLREDETLKCWYCDIVRYEELPEEDGYVVVDLLADVIVDGEGKVRVVDLDELADAYEQNLINKEDMCLALRQLNALLEKMESGEFETCISELGN